MTRVVTIPGIDPSSAGSEPSRPSQVPSMAQNSTLRHRNFQASALGSRVVDRQAIGLSLMALEPWQVGIVASLSWR
jgi:hypothetical protein